MKKKSTHHACRIRYGDLPLHSPNFSNPGLRFFLAVMMLLVVSFSHAQTITYPSAAQPLTRGMGSSLLSVNVGFTAACTGVNVEIPLPAGVSYVSGSVVATGGAGGLTITENGGTKSRPKFLVSNAVIGNNIAFTIARIADCGAGASGKDSVYVTSSCGTVSELGAAVNTYNILAPSLSITPPAAIANANVGGTYSRTFSVTNGGNGCLDTLRLGIKRPSGSIASPVLKIGATVIAPTGTNADSTFYKIYAADLPGGDNLMCNGEMITFTEEFTLLNCAGLTTTYLASWGRPGNICQTTSATGIVTMSSGVPNLVAAFSAPPMTNCGVLPRTYTLTITNNGTTPASNINVTIGNASSIFIPSYAYYIDTTSVLVTAPSLAAYHPTNLNVAGRLLVAYLNNTVPLCAGGKVGMFDFNMPSGYTLAAGQSITVTFNMQTCEGNQCNDNFAAGNVKTAITYKDQCGINNYLLPFGTPTIAPGPTLILNTLAPQFPAQVASGSCFEYKLDLSMFKSSDPATPFGYVEYGVTVPAGFSLNTAVESGSGLVPHAGYPKMIGNVAIFRHNIVHPPGTGQSAHTVKFNFCVDASVCGTFPISAYATTSRDSTCTNPIVAKECVSGNIDVFCGVPCVTGGVIPTTWSYYRSSYGLPDNDNDGIPDPSGSIDFTKIDRDRYRPGDILHSEYKSYIANQSSPSTITNWNYVYSDWTFSTGKWAPSGTATVTIKRGATTYSLTGITISTVTAGTAFKADWSTNPALPLGFTYQQGDSVIVEADFMVDGNPISVSAFMGPGFSSDAPGIIQLSQMVYASQTANPAAGPGSGPDRFTCFVPKYNANVIGLQHWVSYDGINENGPVGCQNFDIAANLYTRKLGTYSSGRYFTFEYRPEAIPDTITLDIPAGWDYVNSLSTTLYYTNAPAIATLLPLTITPTASGYMGGTRLTYDIKTLLQNGTIPHWGTDGMQLYLSNRIRPNCSTPATANVTITEYGHMNDYPNSTNPQHFVLSDTRPINYNLANRPAVALQNNTGEVQGTLPQHFWDVQVNSTGSTNAPYVWLALEQGASGISIDSVVLKPSNVVMSAATYAGTKKWYQVNAAGIASGSNQQARVYFKYNSCEADSIKLLTGWSCSGFPAPDPTANSCSEISTYLKVLPQPSQIQLSVAKQPLSPSIALCTQDNVEAVVNSALGANVDNPGVTVVVPAGMTITLPIEVEYPLGSGIWQNVTPTVSGTNYIVNLENHTGIGANGLPGTILNPGADGRQAKIRVTYNTTCDFISGSKIGFVTNGQKPCGGTVTGDGNFASTNPVNITGATAVGTAGLTMNLANTVLTCSAPENMALEIIPVGSATAVGDTAVYTLPEGLNYTGTFAPGANCTGCTITATLSAGSTILKIAIPSGIAAGSTIGFTIGIQASGNGNGCGEKTILGELRRTGATLQCGGVDCPKPSTSVVGNASQVVTILKPKLDVSAFNFTQTGATINYTVQLTNNGTAASAAGYALKIYCGAPSGGVVLHTITTNALAAAGTDSYTGSFSTGGCAAGTQLVAQVDTAMANGAHPACTCSTPSPSTSAPLPVTLVSFKASKEGQTAVLEWVTTAETNSERFEIERSQSGRYWSKSGELKAKGESSEIVNYTFKDTDPENGDNLYRLKMIDQDQTFTFSRVVSLNFDIKDKVNLFPSPVSELLTIKVRDWNDVKDVEMFDANGKLVYESHRRSAVEPRQQINVKHLAQGVYMVKLTRKNGTMTTHKIVVVK
ncbi:T9SS type A sorting domain-containing protein [Dyadobacter sp. 32]|uniref:T9SS type A sorting domain-containing protein n=1 Tax=Dyadobacter sp. 32 TaxID=538966 RepID=UPI0039C6D235